MTAKILVTSPYQPFTMPKKFSAVFNGYVWCGVVDKDPQQYPVKIYVVNEDGSRTEVSQPLRTNAGGFLVYNGNPANFVTDSNHSLLVQDSHKGQVWYEPDMSTIDPQTAISILGNQSREALRRSYAEAGFNLVDGSFETGGALVNPNDALLQSTTGKAFTGPSGSVPAGTNPTSGGFSDVSSPMLSSSPPIHVDYYKYPTTTDTEAIDAAMAASKHVVFAPRKYTYTKELVSTGHTLEGAVSETFTSTGTIIEFDIQITPSSGFAFRNAIGKGFVSNIKFIQKNWTIPLNGFRADRTVSTLNVEFSYFNGHGAVLTSVDSQSQVCYSSSLRDMTCDYNAKHGIVLGGAANAVVIDNPRCRWNGSPSYGVQPTSVGAYDGIYSGGKNSEFPGNPGIFNDPQGVIIIGGDHSYNSRKGLNLDRFFDGIVLGGYAEGNKGGDIAINCLFGSVVQNYMAQTFPAVSVPSADPLNPGGIKLADYPNHIVIRGRNYGIGQQSSTTGVYDTRMPSMLSIGSLGSSRVLPSKAGGVRCEQIGGGAVNWHFGDLPVLGRTAAFGDGYADSAVPTGPYLELSRAGNTEGAALFRGITGGQYAVMYVANGSGANTAGTALLIPKNSTTSRSINAGGTVNATGADYAEYMYKSATCGEINKGDVCGVTANGELTDVFDDAVSFVVKSTDPSYVGGDTWFNQPVPEPDIDKEGNEVNPEAHAAALAKYNAELEQARAKVDRIAFAGQVPCNVFGATAGDYIVPIRKSNGTIGGCAVKTPSLEQYQISVGKVWAITDDGRAWVAVKVV
ncbi:MAG: phage tailspike protein [Aeromonas veronii]